MQVTKTFASCKVFVYERFLCFTFQTATYWNCHLHKRFLPDEVFQWWWFFSGDGFPFFRAGFANIPSTFLISCEVQTMYSKALKYSQQYIWDHLPGTKVRICICSEHDAVFNSSCIAFCNLTSHLLSLSYHFYVKNQTRNLSNSQLVLSMLLKYCSLKFS